MNTLRHKTIHLNYYALLRERTGKSEEDFKTTATTASELYKEVQARYNLGLREGLLRVSINDAFSTWPAKLKTGDHVVFIPPVSGG